jgi:D-glycero-beta-D-manno-heptose-7-phosphate kinase
MSFAVSKERLLALVSSFAGRRLLVAGDYVLDRFVFGHPKRISREAPVLILRFLREESLPGAAGNTAANVRARGGTPLPVGAVGDDEAGASLTSIFRERGIATDGLIVVAGYRTPTKTRVLAGAAHSIKQQVVRYDQEDHLSAQGGWRRRFSEELARAAATADAAVLSDYGYRAISPGEVAVLRARLRPGALVLVDSRRELASYRGVDAATPNEEELEESAGGSLGDSPEALADAGDRLRRHIGCRTLLVTRGSRGMALFDGAARPTLIPVHGTDQVADVTGAGDTVLATFSLALASGATPLEAALLANFAGGVVVMKMGTATASADELTQAIASDRTLLP